MEAKLSDSKIILPIGTEISLKMGGKNYISNEWGRGLKIFRTLH